MEVTRKTRTRGAVVTEEADVKGADVAARHPRTLKNMEVETSSRNRAWIEPSKRC